MDSYSAIQSAADFSRKRSTGNVVEKPEQISFAYSMESINLSVHLFPQAGLYRNSVRSCRVSIRREQIFQIAGAQTSHERGVIVSRKLGFKLIKSPIQGRHDNHSDHAVLIIWIPITIQIGITAYAERSGNFVLGRESGGIHKRFHGQVDQGAFHL